MPSEAAISQRSNHKPGRADGHSHRPLLRTTKVYWEEERRRCQHQIVWGYLSRPPLPEDWERGEQLGRCRLFHYHGQVFLTVAGMQPLPSKPKSVLVSRRIPRKSLISTTTGFSDDTWRGLCAFSVGLFCPNNQSISTDRMPAGEGAMFWKATMHALPYVWEWLCLRGKQCRVSFSCSFFYLFFFFILSQRRLVRVEEQLATIFEILKKMLDVNSASLPPHPRSPTHSHHATLPPPLTDSLPLTSRSQMLGPDIGNYFPNQGTNRNPGPIQADEGGSSSMFIHLITDPL